MWKMGLLAPVLCPSLHPVPWQSPAEPAESTPHLMALGFGGEMGEMVAGGVRSDPQGAAPAVAVASYTTARGEEAPE